MILLEIILIGAVNENSRKVYNARIRQALYLGLHLRGEVLAWVGPVLPVPAVVALQAAARGLWVGRGGLHLGVVTHHLQH